NLGKPRLSTYELTQSSWIRYESEATGKARSSFLLLGADGAFTVTLDYHPIDVASWCPKSDFRTGGHSLGGCHIPPAPPPYSPCVAHWSSFRRGLTCASQLAEWNQSAANGHLPLFFGTKAKKNNGVVFCLSVVPPSCPRPSVVAHGRGNLTETNRGSFSVGTVLQYSCDPGYVLDGYSTVNCTASGNWNAEPPRCIKKDVCQPPVEPENGGYNCHPSPCHSLTQDTVIEYFCDEGYILKGGYHFRTCENGEWNSPMLVSCHPVQGEDDHSTLPMPPLSIVALTASCVAFILLLVVLREQGALGQPPSMMVGGVQVSLPSYEEAVYGAGGSSVPPPESRVQIVLSEGPQAEVLEQAHTSSSFPSTSSSASSHHAETVLVHQVPSSSSSSPSWAAEQPGATAAPLHRWQSSDSSDQHSLLSLTSVDDYGDGEYTIAERSLSLCVESLFSLSSLARIHTPESFSPNTRHTATFPNATQTRCEPSLYYKGLRSVFTGTADAGVLSCSSSTHCTFFVGVQMISGTHPGENSKQMHSD
ncbi:hypothetical protein DNTS_023896, partial [Danionella cerebrum]